MNDTLGARLGTKHHTPDVTRDLEALLKSMREHGIFSQQPGRVIEGIKKPEVPNAITVGLQQLKTPLKEYNTMFAQLQRRRRGIPLADIPLPTSIAASSASATQPSSDPPPQPMNAQVRNTRLH